jgi:hypothetical protein
MKEIVAKRIQNIKRKKEMEDFIEKLKEITKKEEAYIEICEKYNKDIDFIDDVNISYDDNLDVSAKTINGDIFLNGKLFDSKEMNDNVRYFCHELTHVAQQAAGAVDGPVDKEDYLDDPNEQEAFQVQLDFMKEHEPPEEIEKFKKLTENL